jgi:hypothetical protein
MVIWPGDNNVVYFLLLGYGTGTKVRYLGKMVIFNSKELSEVKGTVSQAGFDF